MALKKVTKKSNVKDFPKKATTTPQMMEQMAEEYDEVSGKVKLLTATKNALSDKIKIGAEELGVKNDKGSFYFETSGYVCGKEAKKSVSLDHDKAIEYLKSKGLANGVVSVVTQEVLDEDAFESLVKSGDISQKDFESLCNIKVTYSVSVKKKEEMPEVQQTTAKAASRKR